MRNIKNKEIRIYIASPYRKGGASNMTRLQIQTADELMDYGYIPYVPLLSHFQDIYKQRTEHEWLKIDYSWLKCCNAVLRLRPVYTNGKEIPSCGADKEVELAQKNNIPVFYSIEELNDYFKSNSKQKTLFDDIKKPVELINEAQKC